MTARAGPIVVAAWNKRHVAGKTLTTTRSRIAAYLSEIPAWLAGRARIIWQHVGGAGEPCRAYVAVRDTIVATGFASVPTMNADTARWEIAVGTACLRIDARRRCATMLSRVTALRRVVAAGDGGAERGNEETVLHLI